MNLLIPDLRGSLQRFWLLAFALMCLLLPGGQAVAGELVTLPARPTATQSIYVDSASNAPPWVIVLFAGDDGAVGLNNQGPAAMRGNFLLRTDSYWLSAGDAIAVFDAPSDHSTGMNDAFRLSAEHGHDIEASVAELRHRYPTAKIALVGTSRGTISVGNALKRTPTLADAYVLTSPVTMSQRGEAGLSGMHWDSGAASVLVISNENDGCPVAPFSGARAMADHNQFKFIAVSSSERRGRDCQAQSPHGFFKIEKQVLDSISGWLNERGASS